MKPGPKPATTSPATRPRRVERDTGTLGEQAAALHLQGLGFRVEARNLRTVHGEIDLLVRRRRLWIAVEVKSSVGHAAPEHTLGRVQLARIARALRALAPLLRPRPRQLRIDAIAVCVRPDGTCEVLHFPALQELGVEEP